ncbi:MAG: Tetraacyldisaccharide 4-kinase [Myxococcaceae bacterium]|nr:Tetraacyldisaccharide 4-kinase [Myxococcaceae bacterium]
MRTAAEVVKTALERVWIHAATPGLSRPLAVPDALFVVTIGGATLGGSGKTPLAIACARALAASHTNVALIGHAYRARPRSARVVSVDDDVAVVGDEALVAARALRTSGAVVIVAPSRQAAITFAVSRGIVIAVVDGPLQLRPRRSDVAWLAVDAASPWGDGACPPRGDLRAPEAQLRALCDRVVPVAGELVLPEGDALASRRVGLVTSLARPERITRALERRGIHPVAFVHAPDHRSASLRVLRTTARTARLDAWLATEKCAAHLERAAADSGAGGLGTPLIVVGYDVAVEPAALAALEAALRARRHA